MKHNIVPLLDVSEHSDSIGLQTLDMPGVPVENLNIDVSRAERAMHWGGIKYLSIGSYSGEGTTYTAGGLKQNMDGTLSMTGSQIAQQASVSAPNSEILDKNEDYGWRNTAVYFNTTALEEITLTPEESASMIDKSFRRTLRGEIRSNEMGLHNIRMEAEGALYSTAAINLVDTIIGGKFSVVNIVGGFVIFLLPKPATFPIQKSDRLFRKKHHQFPPKYSSMFSYKFDRAALAARHLARPIISLADSN